MGSILFLQRFSESSDFWLKYFYFFVSNGIGNYGNILFFKEEKYKHDKLSLKTLIISHIAE